MSLENIINCNPSQCISAKVLRLNRITAGIFRKHLSPYGITDSQLSVLFVLTKAGSMTQQQLADFAKLEKSSMSRNLQRLFDKGYLIKEASSKVNVTVEGKTFVNNIVPAWDNAMAEIRALLGEDGESALNLVLNKLT